MTLTMSIVAKCLQPWLGKHFISNSNIVDKIYTTLINYDENKKDFYFIFNKMSDTLIVAINTFTKGSMKIKLDNNKLQLCNLDDINDMCDDLMGLIFESIDVNENNFKLINEYSIKQNSLISLKVLYLLYKDFYSSEDYNSLALLIRKLYPPFIYKSWLFAE